MNALKLFSADQLRKWDTFTIEQLPIRSLDLMEQASIACVNFLLNYYKESEHFTIFCGKGNNGGDGLAIARILQSRKRKLSVYIVNTSINESDDFTSNLLRLDEETNIKPIHLNAITDIKEIGNDSIIIDAIFGSGLNREVRGLASECINYINNSKCSVASIDLPSGLYSDKSSIQNKSIIEADLCLSFQTPKLAFMFPENYDYCKVWRILDIGLSQAFYDQEQTKSYILDKEFIRTLLPARLKFDHKGKHGHVLIIAGSKGRMGAVILACSAALRSGAGLVTINGPASGNDILQTAMPEAMYISDPHSELISSVSELNNYTAVAIGPGIGIAQETNYAIEQVLKHCNTPLLLDADALNILAKDRDLLNFLPENSVLTPHVKEFERLVGSSDNDFDRHNKQLEFSKKYKVYIVLKGAHTCITCPDGVSYFNNTGNNGMAKGGSGDLLTGLISGLMAQSISTLDATLAAVYIHGMAGDIAADQIGITGMKASDISEAIPLAFKHIETI